MKSLSRTLAMIGLTGSLYGQSGLSPARAEGGNGAPLPQHLTVRICEDDAEWPPFLYHERLDGKPTGRTVGITAEVLNRILGPAGIGFRTDFIPWKRCQSMLETGGYDLAVNASYSDERAHTYILGKPYYWLHSYYYYSRRQHPRGLAIETLSDLKHYHVCGLLGDNYATYELQPSDMDLLPHSYVQMIEKLHLGRCDLFIEKREIIAGFVAVDAAMAREVGNPDLVGVPMNFVPPTPFHMMASPALPWGATLIELLDSGVAALQQNGEMARIIDAFVK